jgi:hypothetical protein
MAGTPTRRGTAWRQGLQVAFPERMKEEDKKVGISYAVRRAQVLPSIRPYVLSRFTRAGWVACVSKRVRRRYNCEIEVLRLRRRFNTRAGISFGKMIVRTRYDAFVR